LEHLDTMAVLAAVVEAEGFSAAARRLGMSKSAVSKQIGRLEAHLGVRLLHRTTRKLSLTEAGRVYYRHVVRVLDEARAAEDAVAGLRGRPQGTLRVVTPMSFGLLHVAPALSAFLREYPELRLELTMEDRLTDLVEGGFDLAIRIGQLRDSSLVARRISSSRVVLCAAPAYLAARGTPATPEDLLAHDCLHFTHHSGGTDWRFDGPQGPVTVRAPARLQANSGLALREAALAGLGILRSPLFTVAEDLRAGRLLSLLPDYVLPPVNIYAVFPEGRHVPAKSRLFVDFLAARIGGGFE